MKASKILAVRGPEAEPATTMMGIPVVYIPFSELNDAWAAADKDEAAKSPTAGSRRPPWSRACPATSW